MCCSQFNGKLKQLSRIRVLRFATVIEASERKHVELYVSWDILTELVHESQQREYRTKVHKEI